MAMALNDDEALNLPDLDLADDSLPPAPGLEELLGAVFAAAPNDEYTDLVPDDSDDSVDDVDLSDLLGENADDDAPDPVADDEELDDLDAGPEVIEPEPGDPGDSTGLPEELEVTDIELAFEEDTELGGDDDLA